MLLRDDATQRMRTWLVPLPCTQRACELESKHIDLLLALLPCVRRGFDLNPVALRHVRAKIRRLRKFLLAGLCEGIHHGVADGGFCVVHVTIHADGTRALWRAHRERGPPSDNASNVRWPVQHKKIPCTGNALYYYRGAIRHVFHGCGGETRAVVHGCVRYCAWPPSTAPCSYSSM